MLTCLRVVHRLAGTLLLLRLDLVCTVYTSQDSLSLRTRICRKNTEASRRCRGWGRISCSCPHTARNSQARAIRQHSCTDKFLYSTWHSCSRSPNSYNLVRDVNIHCCKARAYTTRHHFCSWNKTYPWWTASTAFLLPRSPGSQQVHSCRRDRVLFRISLFLFVFLALFPWVVHIGVEHSRPLDWSPRQVQCSVHTFFQYILLCRRWSHVSRRTKAVWRMSD